MIPVVTPEEMAAIDAAAPEPVGVLIGRAGAATARAAVRLMGGTYGRRVVVVAGKGNNGNDGRDAATRLRRRGVRVTVVPAAEAPDVLPPTDLVIDAAYGTGFRGEYKAPKPSGTPLSSFSGGAASVLAVDIPSGVDGLTGQAGGLPLPADATVTFAAMKPGLLFHPGRALAGRIEVADIGLDVTWARAGVVEDDDVARWLPRRAPTTHKWKAAVLLVAGSPGMPGAAALAASSAQRAGAGMVRYVLPGGGTSDLRHMPVEAVGVQAPDSSGLEETVATELGHGRWHAVVIGPGLGTAEATLDAIRRIVADVPDGVGLLVDGDGLTALADVDASAGGSGSARGAALRLLRTRSIPAVLTPHDGEYARLMGRPPGPDRCDAARLLAERSGAVTLLKGPTIVVAHPDGRARIVTAGDERLATAGTGDVLSGIIGALLAEGVDPFDAAAAGAWLHGSAARRVTGPGLVASDIVTALPGALESVVPF
jgi:NAD(P)H-hydrate epimerase